MSAPELSWRAVLAGAGVALIFAVPAALLSQRLDRVGRVDDDSSVLFLFAAVIIAGLVIGGAAAATKRPDAPLSHGMLAALAAFALVQGIGIISRLARDDAVTWSAVAFNSMVAMTAGLLGALLATQVARRRR